MPSARWYSAQHLAEQLDQGFPFLPSSFLLPWLLFADGGFSLGLATTTGGFFSGRLLSFFWAKTPPETMVNTIAAARRFRFILVILFSLLMPVKPGAWEGEQRRAACEKSNINAKNQ